MKTFLFSLLFFSVRLALIAFAPLFPSPGSAEPAPWIRVDEGLHVSEFDFPMGSTAGERTITVVKVDPKFYAFRLLCASEHGGVRMTARRWCERFNLIAAINAGMYQKDGLTNVGLMKNFGHVNNPRLHRLYQAVLAFNPSEPEIPEIQIIDLKCQDFSSIGPKYHTLIQNIRMISCRQENVWFRTDPFFGMAVFGIDKSGHALLAFTEALSSGHEFSNALLSLPISIFNALYLEGGAEASLFLSWKGMELEKIGHRERGFQENPPRVVPRAIPNVIGIIKKGP